VQVTLKALGVSRSCPEELYAAGIRIAVVNPAQVK
jgi:hypothetical protein